MVERKVTAASISAAVTGVILWVLAKYVFRAEVPDALVAFILVVVPAVVAFLAGYRAPHTARPDLPTDKR